MVRESIVTSNEHRSGVLTDRGLRRLFDLFSQSHDEYDWSLMNILYPLAYEQFQYQESTYEELSRVVPLLAEPVNGAKDWPWEDLFADELPHVIQAAFFIQGMVLSNGGQYVDSTLDQPDLVGILRHLRVDARTVKALGARLTRRIPDMRTAAIEYSAGVPAHFRRYAYNPLVSTPLVQTAVDSVQAPVPELIIQSVMPRALYHAGYDAWGQAFTRDFGVRVQAYVGRQLQQGEPNYRVLPELIYGRNDERSADWILVGTEAVVVVECKSARMSVKGRLGGNELEELMTRYIEKGKTQIDRTADLIQRGESAFSHIPNDRPILGLIITAEPFYLANLPDQGRPDHPVTTIVASIRDLEHLMSLPYDSVLPTLIDIAQDPEKRTWQLTDAIRSRLIGRPRNALLDAAWAATPIAQVLAEHRPAKAFWTRRPDRAAQEE